MPSDRRIDELDALKVAYHSYAGMRSNPYWRTCPCCQGSGINPKLPTMVCPKCQGERKVPRQ